MQIFVDISVEDKTATFCAYNNATGNREEIHLYRSGDGRTVGEAKAVSGCYVWDDPALYSVEWTRLPTFLAEIAQKMVDEGTLVPGANPRRER